MTKAEANHPPEPSNLLFTSWLIFIMELFEMLIHRLLFELLLAAFLTGACAGCGGNPPVTEATTPSPTSIAVTPASAALAPGGTVQFSATVMGGSAAGLTWSVNGTVGGSAAVGTISASGLYMAPQSSGAMLINVQAAVGSTAAMASLAVIPPGTVSTTANPLVAIYALAVPEASTVSIQFGPDTNYGLDTWSQTTPAGGGPVKIMVAGMRASTAYHMRATVQLSDGTQFNDSDHMFTSGGLLPSQALSLTATTTPGMTPSSGIEMLDFVHTGSIGPTEDLVAVDLSGNVVWYYDVGDTAIFPDPVKLLPDGNMLINYNSGGADGMQSRLEEVDLAGEVIWQMHGADLNAALAAAGYDITIIGTHHDFAILPNGHIIVIASTVKNFTDLPGYPGTTAVTGDVLIDLDTNHKPVWVWSEFDHLDVNRHPMMFPDWTHTNAVLYSSSDGDLIISIRHQFWLIKIDYNNGQGSGDIVWKLGWQGEFTLVGGTDPVDWFYAQHGPSFVSDVTSGNFQLTLFDNGNNRPNVANGGQPCGVAPDHLAIAVCRCLKSMNRQDRHYPVGRQLSNLFSLFGGNAEVLANGNAEFDECSSGGTIPLRPLFMRSLRTPPPKPSGNFRSQTKMPTEPSACRSLYPGVQW